MKKKLVKIILAGVILLILIVVVLHFTIDAIAKGGLEKGGTYTLGVGTRVDKVGVSLLHGQMTMDQLVIDNPKGYLSPVLMKSGHWDISVKTGSLFSQTVDVPKIELDGLDVNIEQKPGTNNISEVISNIKRLGSNKTTTKAGKKLRIDSIIIRNVTAHVQLLVKGSVIDVKVPIIQLKNVGSDSSGGVLVSDLTAQVFPAIIAGILDKGKGILPPDLANTLSKDVIGAAQALGGGAAKLIGQAGSDLGKAIDTIQPQPVKDAAKGVGNAIDDLFGKKKPQE